MSSPVETVAVQQPEPEVVVDTSVADEVELDLAATCDYAEQMLDCQMRIDNLARDFDLAEAEAESASAANNGMYTFHFHNGSSSAGARSVLGRRILEEYTQMDQICMLAEEAGVYGEESKAIKNIQKALVARILKGDGDAAVAKTAAIKNIQKALTARILKGDGDAAVAKTAAIKNIQKALTARVLKRGIGGRIAGDGYTYNSSAYDLDDHNPLTQALLDIMIMQGIDSQTSSKDWRDTSTPTGVNIVRGAENLESYMNSLGLGIVYSGVLNQVTASGAPSNRNASIDNEAASEEWRKNTLENLSKFATGMTGDEDLGQDIIMEGEKFHY